MTSVLHLGDCFDVLRTLPDASVHAIVTDPPYGINFMGKAWDGEQIQRDAERNERDTTGLTRLTGGSDPGTARKVISRSASAFQNRAGEAGAYDFSLRGNHAFQQWCEQWGAECLRVLKPGGHLLSFGGTRTYHRLTAGLEDAGFEIRDCLAWMFGSGFPKSLDVSKALDKAAGAEREVVGIDPVRAAKLINQQGDYETEAGWSAGGRSVEITEPSTEEAAHWQGWGTALKPAYEPIVLARKPLVGTVAANVLQHGTGALNVDGCRIGTSDNLNGGGYSPGGKAGPMPGDERTGAALGMFQAGARPDRDFEQPAGRWPANVVLDEEAAVMLDARTGVLTSGSEPAAGFVRHEPSSREGIYGGGKGLWSEEQEAGSLYGDSGGASRFFYCAKVSRAERSAGLNGFPLTKSADEGYGSIQTPILDRAAPRENWEPHRTANHHPTVKPIALMRWLIRLVTPPGGTVLDPFLGSGTTGIAAALEGFDFIGIEREADYHRIAEARIAWWTTHGDEALEIAKVAERERPPDGQQSLLTELT